MSVSQVTLARRTMGVGLLVAVAMIASSPQTVLNGGIPTTYARTGVLGVPLSFLIVMVVLAWLSVGSLAVSRHVQHGAPFYAQLALGFGPSWGLVGAGIAQVGYNCLQISLFPLLGTTAASVVGVAADTWWIWALPAWGFVLFLGQFPGAANAKLLGVLLACEVAIVLVFDIAAFVNPAGGTTVSLDGFAPSNLLIVGGGAGAMVFAGAANAGAEGLPAHGEEARTTRDVVVASLVGYLLLGLLYALSAWAYLTAVGAAGLATAEQDKTKAPMEILAAVWGPGFGLFGNVLVITSVTAAMLAFHGYNARYTYALGRENVLPKAFAAVTPGRDGGAPRGGAFAQAAISFVVVAVFVIGGAAPIETMFVWLSTIGAVCVLVLLTLSSFAAVNYFAKGEGGGEPWVVRQFLPFSGGVIGILALVFMLSNLNTLLGLPPGSGRAWLVGGLLAGAVLGTAGVVGQRMKRRRPADYDQMGRGTPDPVMVRDARLRGLQL
jgi:amino acid transporter